MTNRAHVLLWTDSTAAYLDAIKAAGLADRVAVDTLPRKNKPSADQLARTEALMAGAVPAGLLPSMPKLRWAQAMTAGVEGWLALPDLPPGLTLTCARGTHTESMPENIMAALFYVAKPVAVAVGNQKHSKWVHTIAAAADRQDARHSRPGRHRPGSRPPRLGVRHARDRHATPADADGQRRRDAAAGPHGRGAGAVRLRAAVAAGDSGDRQSASMPSGWRR